MRPPAFRTRTASSTFDSWASARSSCSQMSSVAKAVRAPLDVFIVRKLGLPWHEELAMGAIASGGIQVVNQSVMRHLGLREGG